MIFKINYKKKGFPYLQVKYGNRKTFMWKLSVYYSSCLWHPNHYQPYGQHKLVISMEHHQPTKYSVPALPWKMGTPSSFWELKRDPFPRIFSAILPPFWMKTTRNQSLNFPPFFLQNKDMFRNLTPFSCEIYPIFQIKSN